MVTLSRKGNDQDAVLQQQWTRQTEGILQQMSSHKRSRRPSSSSRQYNNDNGGFPSAAATSFIPRRSKAQYKRDIAKCHEYIRQGESYELCLTNQWETVVPKNKNNKDPLGLYKLLRERNPAPFSAFVKFPNVAICSSSPERFISVTPKTNSMNPQKKDWIVEARPIKGTIARPMVSHPPHHPQRPCPIKDAQSAAELQSSVKDRAENLMIVDLLRNDLSRVCQVGSVHVPHLMHIESYATVHQMVSTVRGTLMEKNQPEGLHVLKACFPGGSMTGAPKKRSMEILHRLEQGEPRGPYSGCLGYWSVNGRMDMNIVIRSAVLVSNKKNEWNISIGTGGAITALSDSQDEYEEMRLKARAVKEAVQLWVAKDVNDASFSKAGAFASTTTSSNPAKESMRVCNNATTTSNL